MLSFRWLGWSPGVGAESGAKRAARLPLPLPPALAGLGWPGHRSLALVTALLGMTDARSVLPPRG